MGHINDFMKCFKVVDGRLSIYNQYISATTNDHLSSKLLKHYGNQLKPDSLLVANSICKCTGNKALQYAIYNDFIKDKNYSSIKDK
jgi:hypothetical protein